MPGRLRVTALPYEIRLPIRYIYRNSNYSLVLFSVTYERPSASPDGLPAC
ncbi:hypothetical protein SMG44B_10048 [Stenotrophomonas maltophilia]